MSNSKFADISVDIAEIESMIYGIASMSSNLERAFDLDINSVLTYDPDKNAGENAMLWLFDNYGTVASGLRMITSVSNLISSAIAYESIAIVPSEEGTK